MTAEMMAESEFAVEQEGLSTKAVFKTAFVMFLALAFIVMFLIQWVNIKISDTEAASASIVTFPEIVDAENQAIQALTQYGVVDQDQGIYRIPIDRAMQLMVNEAQSSGQQASSVDRLYR